MKEKTIFILFVGLKNIFIYCGSTFKYNQTNSVFSSALLLNCQIYDASFQMQHE